MDDTVVIGGDVSLINQIDGEISLKSRIDGESGVFYEVSHETHETYQGPYAVTPSEESQTLSTADLIMGEDVVIDPIPANYGRITWNGSVLLIT